MQRDLFSSRLMLAVTALVATAASEANAAIKHRYSLRPTPTIRSAARTDVRRSWRRHAMFAGGKLNLTANIGETSNAITKDAYVDLPNGIVSALGTKGSFETWVTVETESQLVRDLFVRPSRQDSGRRGHFAGTGKYITLIPSTRATGVTRFD